MISNIEDLDSTFLKTKCVVFFYTNYINKDTLGGSPLKIEEIYIFIYPL